MSIGRKDQLVVPQPRANVWQAREDCLSNWCMQLRWSHQLKTGSGNDQRSDRIGELSDETWHLHGFSAVSIGIMQF